MKARDFLRARESLRTEADANLAIQNECAIQQNPSHPRSGTARRDQSTLEVGNNFTDPKAFLLAVMNDASASSRDRIEAARALLPYCHGPASE